MSASDARVRPAVGSRRGFTLVEIVVVLAIASILMSIMLGALGRAASQRSALSARDAYIWMGRRARAAAIQRGLPVRYTIKRSGRAVVSQATNSRIIDQLYFSQEFGTIVTLASDSVSVVYDPRGIANPQLASAPTVQFSRGGSSAQATVQVLGQVEAVQ